MRRADPWLVAGLILCGLLLFIAAYGDRLAPNEPVFLMVNGPAGTERPLPPGEPGGRDLQAELDARGAIVGVVGA